MQLTTCKRAKLWVVAVQLGPSYDMLLLRTVHMDHYSKCNQCGEMVKNIRQHEKHKHRGNQKVRSNHREISTLQHQLNPISGQMCHMQQFAEVQKRGTRQ